MKVAVYSGTRNIYHKMVPSIKALLHNSDVNKIYVLIEDDEFPEYLPPECECINISNQKYFDPEGPNFKSPWSYMVLLRAAYHKIFPDLDKILSIDVDAFTVRRIDELWNALMDDCYICAVQEKKNKKYNLYVNCGVMLMDLKKLRDGKGDEIIAALNKNKYEFAEQDCFNFLCAGHIATLPAWYNAHIGTYEVQNPKIIHYAGRSHWPDSYEYRMFDKMPWEEVRK